MKATLRRLLLLRSLPRGRRAGSTEPSRTPHTTVLFPETAALACRAMGQTRATYNPHNQPRWFRAQICHRNHRLRLPFLGRSFLVNRRVQCTRRPSAVGSSPRLRLPRRQNHINTRLRANDLHPTRARLTCQHRPEKTSPVLHIIQVAAASTPRRPALRRLALRLLRSTTTLLPTFPRRLRRR